MLEQMRKSSQSLLIYVLFGIVIAVFIINFGPQSRGGSCESTMANDHYAAKVSGQLVTRNDFRYGFLVLGGAQYPAQIAKQQHLKETVMDKLIERELLAAEAERLGYVISDEQVEDQIGEAKLIGLGYPRAVPRMTKDGKFNYDAFKNFVQFELGVTPQGFIDEQKKELLAARVRDLLRGSVTVSPNEVKADFLRKNMQVNLEYVRFAARDGDEAIPPTQAQIADYAAKNEAKLKAMYEERKFVYENVPKERHLRQIMVKLPSDAKADVEKAALKRAEGIAARVKKGEPFEKVARETSDDVAAKARGGDLGWRGKSASNLPAEQEKQLLAAKTGDVVGPLKGAGGFYVTKLEGEREGNVPFDKVKLELAEEKVRAEGAGARAKARAEAALALARSESAKTLKDIFPAPAEDKDARHDDENGAAKAGAAPRAEETGLFSPKGTREGAMVEGIGASNDLAKAAFALTTAAPLAGPFEVAGSWIIVRLKERKDPDMAEFEKKQPELVRDAELTKWIEVLTDWTHARCVEARDGNRIQINRDELRYEDSGEPPAYEPCLGRRQIGG
ncbi:MAG TPA: SurA N-terminal domain-containing protein [Polyangia bacterium]|jgi:peptidyl-prolyl cis-trans isomerase D|nr:SurA N-terminal domain-containing protein [Polyangia bacterium]